MSVDDQVNKLSFLPPLYPFAPLFLHNYNKLGPNDLSALPALPRGGALCDDPSASNYLSWGFSEFPDDDYRHDIYGARPPKQLDTSSALFVTPQWANQSPTMGLGYGKDVSNSSSPDTISSGTVSGQSPAEHGPHLQIVHFRPQSMQTTPPSKRGRAGKPQEKRRFRGLSTRPDALKNDTAPKIMLRKDARGAIAGIESVFGSNQVVRATMSSELQLATIITRKFGACERCRQQRVRCDMAKSQYQPCGRCVKLSENPSHQPCLRINILDLNLHRKGSTLNNAFHVWVQEKIELQKTSPQDNNIPITLFLTQDRGEGFENALSVTVSRFEPEPGDKTAHEWTGLDGQRRTMEMPPYFISDLEGARRNIREFSRNVRSAYIETILTDSNPIVCQTFQAALAYTAFNPNCLVSDALRCWVVTRFIERSWRIFCGWSSLGIEPPNEPGHPYNGIIPVTPVMDTQLDDLVIGDILIPLTNTLLNKLKDKIVQQKKENWLEIYLTTFIMMSNMGWVMKDVVDWTSRLGLKSGSRGGTLTQGYIHACKTILAYFHFACRGSIPLSIPGSKLGREARNNTHMTQDQIRYLRSIQPEISRQESKLVKWRDMSMYDDEMYWCSQMLFTDWRGDEPYGGEIDDFTEEDFLTS